MSVLTILLLLVTCFSTLAHGARNKKDHESFQFLSRLPPWEILPNSLKNTRYPGLTASGSSKGPLSNDSVTGSRCILIPSGTVNSGSSFGTSSIVPYPTEGAAYQNSTSLYTKLGNGGSETGQTRWGNQCPSQETVTLPPQTITLPAHTVTMTLIPETITVTPQVQIETTTVTVTAQTQTTTVTFWMTTVTANQVPSCPGPSNAASPPIPSVPAQIPQPSTTPLARVSDNASTPVIVPPIVTTPNMILSSASNVVPIANATSSATPNLGPITAVGSTITIHGDNHVVPVAQQTFSSIVSSIINSNPNIAPYPYRNTTNQTLPFGSGSSRGFRPTGSGIAKPTNKHISSFFLSKFITETPISTTTVGPSSTRQIFPGNGSSLLIPPSQANVTVFQPTARPTPQPFPDEYFPDDGSSLLTPPAPANATTSPVMEYFPDDGSSLLTPPAQASATTSPTVEYFPDDGSSLLTPPAQASATTSPTVEYFPDDGSSLLTPPAQASATTSPTVEYFPDDGSSLLAPPAQSNATSVPLIGGNPAPVITPAVVGSSQTSTVVLGSVTPPPPAQIIQSNTSTSILPLSTPIIPPPQPILQPNTSTLQPASTSGSGPSQPPPPPSNLPLCTNGITVQNITENFSSLQPIPSLPLILQGLNYTTFAPTTNTNSTPHLLAPASSQPKQISLASASISFSLTSLTLSCDTPQTTTTSSSEQEVPSNNCTIQIIGTGVAGTGTEMSTVIPAGAGMHTLVMAEGWQGLSTVRFSAEVGGVQTGVGLGGVGGEVVGGC